jgi:protein transport protein HofC
MLFFLLLLALAWLQWRGVRRIRLPGVSRVIDWVDAGPVLRVLALVVEHRRPMNRGMALLARYHPKRSVRARLAAALRQMDDGMAWQEALRRQRLIGAADATMLAAAQRNGNVDWALGELADSLERRANHRLQAVAQVVLPAMVLPVAALVALLAVAYFLPIVELIKALS